MITEWKVDMMLSNDLRACKLSLYLLTEESQRHNVTYGYLHGRSRGQIREYGRKFVVYNGLDCA
jgi:hypothetical protein